MDNEQARGDKSNRNVAALWTGQYTSILFGTFVCYVGFQMLVPTLAAYIKQLGGTNLSASLTYSAAAAAALVARSVFGAAMDRIGRKPVLLAGMAVLIAANILLSVVTDIAAICVIRFAQGIGWGMVSTALATIVSDLVPARRMGEGIGYFSLSIALATSLSIIVGIWLMNRSGFMAMLGFSISFFAVALVLGMALGSVPFHRHARSGQAGRPALIERRALLPAFLCFLHSVAFSGIMTFIMLFGAESGIRDVHVYFIGHVLMVLASRPLVGRIYDRRGHSAVIVPGVLSMIAGLVLLSYAHGIALLVTASLFYGLGYGMVQPALQAWAVGRSPSDRKGAANGTFLSSIDLGYAVGAVATGAIAAATSYAVMYRLSSLLLVLFLAIYLPLPARRSEPREMAGRVGE